MNTNDDDFGYESFSNGSESPRIVIKSTTHDNEVVAESLTDYSAIDAVQRVENTDRRNRTRKSRLNVPNNPRVRGHSESVFSPSPLNPSPVSLLGGYMGISVPTTMNNIIEELDGVHEIPTRGRSVRRRGSKSESERQPLLSKSNNSYSSGFNQVTVTAIVEDHSSRRRDPSGGIA